ncbi:MAG: adenylate/guanylate cyclase domain-containing protein, partial [Thermoplasmata archaeon]
MPSTRRLAAIMFTDMVGSTALAQSDESKALRLRDEQETLVLPLFEAHHGRAIKSMGDGFLAEFESALRAVQCAIEIQQRLHERNSLSENATVQLRIGIHLGDVEQRETDIFGDAVNIASRIEPLASPGGVCISGDVFNQIRNKIPNKLEKLPPASLKGLQGPMDVYRVVLPWVSRNSQAYPSTHPGIAVLPFANISPDPTDGYFADGLTEELIAVLSQVPELRVIARTSIMQYKTTLKPVSQIAAELGVTAVLEGSVRKAGNRLRITAQLIDAPSEGHLWTNTYDRQLDDVFELQSEMARQVADALKVKLLAGAGAHHQTHSPPRPESYLEYLQGRTSMHIFSEPSLRAAQAHFERAIVLDDQNAAAHAGLADIHRLLGGMFNHLPRPEWDALSRDHASRAVELDPELAEGHASLGLILWDDYQYPDAETEFEKALRLNPSFAWARMGYAGVLSDQLRTEEALREQTLAEQLDPLSTLILNDKIQLLIYLRRLDEAEALIGKLGRVEGDGLIYHNCIANLSLARGDQNRFLEELNILIGLLPGRPEATTARAILAAWAGQKERARELLESVTSLPLAVRPDSQ